MGARKDWKVRVAVGEQVISCTVRAEDFQIIEPSNCNNSPYCTVEFANHLMRPVGTSDQRFPKRVPVAVFSNVLSVTEKGRETE